MRNILILLFIGGVLSIISPVNDPNISEAFISAAIAVASLAMGAYQMYESNRQAKQARDLANTPQPMREIPSYMKKAVKTQGYLASLTKAPGSAYEKAYAEEKAAQLYEEAKNISSSPSQAQGALESKYGDLTEMQRDREIRNLTFQAEQKQNLVGVQRAMADMQWDQDSENIMDPYYRKMAASSALREASEANKWGAIGNTMGSLTALAPEISGGFGGKGKPPSNGVSGRSVKQVDYLSSKKSGPDYIMTDNKRYGGSYDINQIAPIGLNAPIVQGSSPYSAGYYQYYSRS